MRGESYTVNLILSHREDIEMILGKEGIGRKEFNTAFAEILCDKVFTAHLKYNKTTKFLQFTLDYVTKCEKIHKRTKKPYLAYVKPAVFDHKLKERTKEFEKRKEKLKGEDFVDHDNIPKRSREDTSVNHDLSELAPQRRRIGMWE